MSAWDLGVLPRKALICTWNGGRSSRRNNGPIENSFVLDRARLPPDGNQEEFHASQPVMFEGIGALGQCSVLGRGENQGKDFEGLRPDLHGAISAWHGLGQLQFRSASRKGAEPGVERGTKSFERDRVGAHEAS